MFRHVFLCMCSRASFVRTFLLFFMRLKEMGLENQSHHTYMFNGGCGRFLSVASL